MKKCSIVWDAVCIVLFFSVGATAPLFIAGLSIGIPGAITGAGAAIASYVIDTKEGNKAAALIRDDEEITKELLNFSDKILHLAVLLHGREVSFLQHSFLPFAQIHSWTERNGNVPEN